MKCEWLYVDERFAVLTLILKLLEQAETGDTWPGENDGVTSRQVLAELPGHQTVELRLVFQCVESIWTRALLQMYINLQREGIIYKHCQNQLYCLIT